MQNILQLIEIGIEWLDKFTIIVASIAAVASGRNWWRNRKQLQKIKIYFQTPNEKIHLEKFDITRKSLTRSELMGILSIIQKDSTVRYNIEHLGTKEFFQDIFDIQNSKKDELVIKLTQKELEQFMIKSSK